MKKYDSPAWISAAMDEAGMAVYEFRVLAHICRRAGDGANGRGCFASIASMAEVCNLDPKTVRASLQSLRDSGWIEAVENPGKVTEYFPCDPYRVAGGVESNPCRPTVAHPSPETVGDPYRVAVAEGIQEGKPLREPKGESTHARPSLIQVVDFAKSSDAGIQPECAEKFWRENEAVGWIRRGQPVMRWKPLLEAYAAAWNRIEAQRAPRAGKMPPMSLEEADKELGRRSPNWKSERR